MSIKVFKGLGTADTSTPPSTGVGTVSRGASTSAVDPYAPKVKVTKQSDNLHTTLQLPAGDVRSNDSPVSVKRPTVDTGIKPKVFSVESGEAPFETLFNDFGMRALPSYNFWTPDELTNDRDGRGNRKLEDVPRYITLEWHTAPNLVDPSDRLRAKDVRVRDVRPVIFSRELERANTFQTKGIGFTPEHLQPGGFEKIKAILADGHLAPGVIEAVVDIPLKSAGIDSSALSLLDRVDEDSFLTDPAYAGLSIHELMSQMNQVSNGIASMGRNSEGVSADMTAQKDELVDGKFTIGKSATPGGKMDITSVHPSSPSLGYSANTAVSSRPTMKDSVGDLAAGVTRETSRNAETSAQVKVKFFNPSIGGLIDQKKVNLMSAPEHVESLSAIAPSLADLEIISRTNLYDRKRNMDIPSIPSPKVKPLEYIGYVIEKYRRQGSGAFVKIDEIDIPSREVDTYIDTKILYGEVYRYRIKTVLRWTRPGSTGVKGNDPTVGHVFASQTAHLASFRSSYFSSEWGLTWAYGTCIDDQPPLPPDELTVRPESHKKRVSVSFRLPENPQKDIWKMRLFRKFKDEHGRDISDWMPIVESDSDGELIDFAPRNVLYLDNDVDFFQRSKTRIVYAAQCISRHGEASYLSEQLCVRLNEEYFSKGEFPVEFVSSAGIRLEYFGAFSTNPVRTTKTEIVLVPPPTRMGRSPGVASLLFSGREVSGNATIDSSRYVCRIQSLDTGETKDLPFQVTFDNLPARQEVAEYDFYVPKNPVPPKKTVKRPSSKDVKKHVEPSDESLRDEQREVKVKDKPSRHERW